MRSCKLRARERACVCDDIVSEPLHTAIVCVAHIRSAPTRLRISRFIEHDVRPVNTANTLL